MSEMKIVLSMAIFCIIGIFSILMCQKCDENETCTGWCYPITAAFCSFFIVFTTYYTISLLYYFIQKRFGCSCRISVSPDTSDQPLLQRDQVDDISSDDDQIINDDPKHRLLSPEIEV